MALLIVALLIAALLVLVLGAQGRSEIQNIHQIDRGYQNIDQRLRALGANIERIR